MTPPAGKDALHLKAVCSNPRQKRERSLRALEVLAERVASSAILNHIDRCATRPHDRTNKGSLSTLALPGFVRKEHPINLQWTLKGILV
jgi:hypothetical protein